MGVGDEVVGKVGDGKRLKVVLCILGRRMRRVSWVSAAFVRIELEVLTRFEMIAARRFVVATSALLRIDVGGGLGVKVGSEALSLPALWTIEAVRAAGLVGFEDVAHILFVVFIKSIINFFFKEKLIIDYVVIIVQEER